jgi:RNA polymerase sigma-70 factor, ECF subfamily
VSLTQKGAFMSASESAIVEEGLYVGFDAATVGVSGADTALVSRLKAGERAAFEELIADYQALIYGLALRLLGDPEEARDVAQETFLKAYRYIGSFRGECGLKTWLYRMTVNQASNHRRWWQRRRRRDTVSLDAPIGEDDATIGDRIEASGRSPEQVALRRERQRLLLVALESLKHDYRVAVVLRDIEELTYEEIAEAAGVPVGTVKSRLARGREELRKRLQEMGV